MALNPTTPGVYVQEISTLPPSVAGVATAIPAFIGYSEKAAKNGDLDALLNVPVRISSLLEYETIFGGPYHEKFSVNSTSLVVTNVSPSPTNYILYYSLQMYFGNGGGPCYIVSVGLYGGFMSVPAPIVVADFFGSNNGVDVAEQVDEVTLLVAPEAIYLGSDTDDVYKRMIDQCAKLQDRFAITDVFASSVTNPNITADASAYRSTIGLNNLKYGCAYYPPLNTTIRRFFIDDDIAITAGAYASHPRANLSSLLTGNVAATSATGFATVVNIPVAGNKITINGTENFTAVASSPGPGDFLIGATKDATAINLANAINANSTLVTATVFNNKVSVKTILTGSVINYAFTANSANITVSAAALNNGQDADITIPINGTLYNQIKSLFDTNYRMMLYPSATMAGVFANVDLNRGVWKAPANVSLNFVDSLPINITDDDQGNLNVDPVGGKSINAIRFFNGRGILVWGARTLDGNSNEWRYINVRRLFIFVEESCKKASEFVVFEPNDKNTWLRVKGTISNFLTDLWREGALAGDKPDQAFFVKVGINETMSAQDILEGRLIVQIGLAAVRPAEFIILQFMHKLQEA